MAPTFWLDLFTGKSWDEFLAAGGRVTGFRAGRWRIVQQIKPDDYLLCYLTGVSRWIGVLKAESEAFHDSTPIWSDDEFPCRVNVQPHVVLEPEAAIPIRELRDQLTIFRDLSHPNAWTGFIRGSPARWRASDGQAVLAALLEASRNPITRPLDKAKLERRPRLPRSSVDSVPRSDIGEFEGEPESRTSEEQYELIATQIEPYLFGNRTSSTALLAWFLEKVWRLDAPDVDQAICDGGGDKGIDALVVDPDLQEITVFQSKHRNTAAPSQGDSDLKAFVGVAAYFKNEASVDKLLASKPNPELTRLLQRHAIRDKIGTGGYSVRLVFVTNALLDDSGRSYLDARSNQVPLLDVWDRTRLTSVAERTQGPTLLSETVSLRTESDPLLLALPDDAKLAIALISGPELVRLPGIQDSTIFDLNVRLGMGRTRINKELDATISDTAEHPLFPAFHNGLTLLTNEIDFRDGEILLADVSVVNGCQSLLALYRNKAKLSPNLRVLVKIVQLDQHHDLVDRITYRTNNQNPVNMRDQRSTDPTQRDLQTQVRKVYGRELHYSIRAGEKRAAEKVLDNALAAQLIMAIWLGQPWNAVRRLRLFDEDYHRVFNRTVDGHKLYVAHCFNEVVSKHRGQLRADLESSFSSVRFMIVHLLAQTVRGTELGTRFLDEPQLWLPARKAEVVETLSELVSEVIESINFYVDDKEEHDGAQFDPKVVFMSQQGVRPLEYQVMQEFRRGQRRHSDFGFQVPPA